MLRLKRVLLRQCEAGWRMSIDLKESTHNPMTLIGYLVPTVERVKELAASRASEIWPCVQWVMARTG
jgi:hypothetical protein